MKEKTRHELSGRLMYPLTVGDCAVFIADGQIYRTSRVVDITLEDKAFVQFETQNSRYSLSLRPFPTAAISRYPVCLAACA